jgi:hypothetical protein
VLFFLIPKSKIRNPKYLVILKPDNKSTTTLSGDENRR